MSYRMAGVYTPLGYISLDGARLDGVTTEIHRYDWVLLKQSVEATVVCEKHQQLLALT